MSTDNRIISPKKINRETRFNFLGIEVYACYYEGCYKIKKILFLKFKKYDYEKLINKKFDKFESQLKKTIGSASEGGNTLTQNIKYIFKRQKSIDSKLDDLSCLGNLSNQGNDSLNKYLTSRIDISILGHNEQGSMEVLGCNDDKIDIKFPNYLCKNNGYGAVVHTKNQKLNLKIRSLTAGKLTIKLKGVDYHPTKDSPRIPIYIACDYCSINGHEYLKKETFVTHDNNYSISVETSADQVLDIEFGWHPI